MKFIKFLISIILINIINNINIYVKPSNYFNCKENTSFKIELNKKLNYKEVFKIKLNRLINLMIDDYDINIICTNIYTLNNNSLYLDYNYEDLDKNLDPISIPFFSWRYNFYSFGELRNDYFKIYKIFSLELLLLIMFVLIIGGLIIFKLEKKYHKINKNYIFIFFILFFRYDVPKLSNRLSKFILFFYVILIYILYLVLLASIIFTQKYNNITLDINSLNFKEKNVSCFDNDYNKCNSIIKKFNSLGNINFLKINELNEKLKLLNGFIISDKYVDELIKLNFDLNFLIFKIDKINFYENIYFYEYNLDNNFKEEFINNWLLLQNSNNNWLLNKKMEKIINEYDNFKENIIGIIINIFIFSFFYFLYRLIKYFYNKFTTKYNKSFKKIEIKKNCNIKKDLLIILMIEKLLKINHDKNINKLKDINMIIN